MGGHGRSEMSEKEMAMFLGRESLPALFEPCDARAAATQGLWPGPNMTEAQLKEAVLRLTSTLCSDTYGGVNAVRFARDTYNSRMGFFTKRVHEDILTLRLFQVQCHQKLVQTYLMTCRNHFAPS